MCFQKKSPFLMRIYRIAIASKGKNMLQYYVRLYESVGDL